MTLQTDIVRSFAHHISFGSGHQPRLVRRRFDASSKPVDLVTIETQHSVLEMFALTLFVILGMMLSCGTVFPKKFRSLSRDRFVKLEYF